MNSKNNGSMNRIFRVVWNAATGVWQAVSEIARGHSKSRSIGESAGQGVVDSGWKLSRLTLAVAATLSVAPLHAGELGAQTATDTNATITVGSGDTVTVTGAGPQNAVNVDFTAGANAFTATISNAGIISASTDDSDAKAIQVHSANNAAGTGAISIGNSGTLSATGNGGSTSATGMAIENQNSLVTINNQSGASILVNSGTSDASGISLLDSNLQAGSAVSNSGSITVTGGGVANGIRINAALNNATITNNGNITVSKAAAGLASVMTGIQADYVFGSAITNTANGSINVSNQENTGGITGISIGRAFAEQAGSRAVLSNAGSISVSGAGDARAIDIASDITGASITNAAHASITATSTGDTARGMFLYSPNVNDLNLTNSGSITASGHSISFGIQVYTESPLYLNDSSITNAGTITVTSAQGRAAGIDVSSDSDASVFNTAIRNTNTITVSAADAAVGINVAGSLLASSIVNSGTISVTSTNNVANGIFVGSMAQDQVNGNLTQSNVTNAGTIMLQGMGSMGMWIKAANDASTIVNAGTIQSGTPASYASGISVDQLNGSASITNSGTISLRSTMLSVGIDLTTLNSNAGAAIENRGTITVDAGMTAAGIATRDGTGAIRNSGIISATVNGQADAKGFSLYAGGSGITVTNTNTGVMNGNLIVAGTLNNAGTISLPHNANTNQGGASALPSATVGTFTNSGTLEIGLLTNGATTTHSQLLTNTATFDTGSKIKVNVLAASTNEALLVGQTLHDVVKATTSLTINATPTVEDNSALLDFQYVKNANSIDLNIVGGSTIVDSTRAGGGSVNALAAAGALMTIQSNGSFAAMTPVFTALNALPTDADVAKAVNSLTPATTMASRQAGWKISNSIQNIVDMRQNAGLTGSSLNSGDPLMADRNFWLKPFGSWGKQDDKGGLNGFDLRTRGIGLGLDGEYAPNQKLGFAFFYSNADVDMNNMAQKADLNVYSALLYGNVPLLDDKTNFLYQAGYTAQQTDTTRQIALTGQTAKGSYTATVAAVDLKLMRDYQVSERLLLQPLVSASYRRLSNPSYEETGAGAANQQVDRLTSSQTTVGVGVRANYLFDEQSKLITNLHLGHDLNSNAFSISSGFAGAPGVRYQTHGIDNGRNSYELGLGYEHKVSDSSKLNLMYTRQGHGSSFANDAISATYTLKF